MAGIDSTSYLNSVGIRSLTSNILLGGINPMSLIGSSGKSGSFFFYSADNRFLIKALKKSEFSTILEILPKIFDHFLKHPKSLISKFFGLHRLTLVGNNTKNTTLIICVMKNVLNSSSNIEKIYDLKGSLYKRKKQKNEPKSAPYKDSDLINSKEKILVFKSEAEQIMISIAQDKNFLAKCGLNDYSLLVGVRKNHIEASAAPVKARLGSPSLKSSRKEFKAKVNFILLEMCRKYIINVDQSR